jgi:dienelactone hydrolase
MRYRILMLALPFLLPITLFAEIVAHPVEYTSGDDVLKGYLAYDDDVKGQRPGVLVVHEWWGHNEYARKRGRMLAEIGYTALAVDMYGDGKTADHPKDAGKFATAAKKNTDISRARFLAAKKLLEEHETTNDRQTAAIGYCFGGGMVLQMARDGLSLAGVVSFHGSLDTDRPAEKGKVKAQILVCHGADDPFVSPEEVSKFKKEMSRAGIDFTFKKYDGAVHSFTNPDADALGKKFGLPLAYDDCADKQSWRHMQVFFKDIFSPKRGDKKGSPTTYKGSGSK